MDSKETEELKPDTLETIFEEPSDVIIFDGFITMPEMELKELYLSLNLAMTFQYVLQIQNY